jgi:hypothetical protein
VPSTRFVVQLHDATTLHFDCESRSARCCAPPAPETAVSLLVALEDAAEAELRAAALG